jgi:hypothetical protein
MTLYNAYGQANTTTVSGASQTGLYAPDGSYNIVLNSGLTGLYHPCGAYNGVTDSNSTGFYNSANGNVYVVPGISPSGYVIGNPDGNLSNNGIRNTQITGAVAGSPGTLPTHWTAGAGPTGLTRTISLSTVNGIQSISINYSGTTTSSASFQFFFEGQGQNTVPASVGQTWLQTAFFQVTTDDPNVTSINFGPWEYNGSSFLITHGTSIYASRLTNQLVSSGNTLLTQATTNNISPGLFTNNVNSSVTVNWTIQIGWPSVQRIL